MIIGLRAAQVPDGSICIRPSAKSVQATPDVLSEGFNFARNLVRSEARHCCSQDAKERLMPGKRKLSIQTTGSQQAACGLNLHT